MKKAQSRSFLVIGFLLILFAAALAVMLFRSSPTGEVISNPNLSTISEPFSLRAWVFSENGTRLDIKNVGQSDVIIRDFTLDGCGRSRELGLLASDEARIFTFSCSLPADVPFEGNLTLTYSLVDSEDVLIAQGVARN
jgi:hypothetical protein